MMNLYFEEVPARDEDQLQQNSEDDICLQEFDTKEEAIAAELSADSQKKDKTASKTEQTWNQVSQKSDDSQILLDKGATQKISMDGGGVLQDLKFESCSLGNATQWLETSRSQELIIEPIVGTSQASLPKPRGGATLATFGENKVVLFGGASRDGSHFADLWIALREDLQNPSTSPKKQIWTKLTKNVIGRGPEARSGHSATVINDNCMVVFGGLNATLQKVYNDIHILKHDESQDQWTWLQPKLHGSAPQRRTEHCAIAVGNRVLVFGGSSPEAGVLRDIHMLTISEDGGRAKWSTVRATGTPPPGRELAACCILHAGHLNEGSNNNNKDNQDDGEPEQAFRVFEHYGEHLVSGSDFASLTRVNFEDAPGIAADKIDEATSLREDGNRKFLAGEFEKAIGFYSQGLLANPRDALLYGNRSVCHLKIGQAQNALCDALAAVRLNPTWGKAYLREAQSLMALGRFEEAQAPLQSAVELASSERERESVMRMSHELCRDHIRPNQMSESLLTLLNGQSDLRGPFFCIHGGRGADGVLRDLCLFHLQTSSWLQPTQDTPLPRCGHSMSLAQSDASEQLFIYGGWDGGVDVFASGALFDSATCKWTDLKSKSAISERFSHAMCKLPANGQSKNNGSSEWLVFGGVSFKCDHADSLLLRLDMHAQDNSERQ
mmetsp:Transcript_16734/g.32542  ORF Transcript_16734/g.32542 Transcript_16734/m.32542 type:complete len:666 (-) Transcript_16734:150-2147(-)|eukprot:CAMPEP_0171565484 /NCGR_PEP_ID=MMETSP0961-20121227/3_1 /TAXON_ID=87120 /ORGANISM="Aurantiochytrium limacinum, Strain ATCCMYA-1381" /LENGTH=665 /DNA_ID=CAMNT_0012119045 /DNA_START=133 /DNA_END=2130 /DNA_ORIENTATION=-